MNQLRNIISDVVNDWMGIYAVLIFGAFVATFTGGFYLWHNALLYICVPIIMPIVSIIISRNCHKKASLIGMPVINIIIILLSCTYFVKMRDSWEKWQEPLFTELFLSNIVYYCIAMVGFMMLAMKRAIPYATVCPKCGEWNTTEILKKVEEGSHETTMKLRNDKKVYDNTGRHVASIESYDTFHLYDYPRSYGHYLCKCTSCRKEWKEDY